MGCIKNNVKKTYKEVLKTSNHKVLILKTYHIIKQSIVYFLSGFKNMHAILILPEIFKKAKYL